VYLAAELAVVVCLAAELAVVVSAAVKATKLI
jgi:hypothetical protein